MDRLIDRHTDTHRARVHKQTHRQIDTHRHTQTHAGTKKTPTDRQIWDVWLWGGYD